MSDGLEKFLKAAVNEAASDLHLVPGSRPIIRKHGKLVELPFDLLDATATAEMLLPYCPAAKQEILYSERNLDFALEIKDPTEEISRRFRANYFFADDELGACFRVIPDRIPNFSWANFPVELADRLTTMRNGIVLFSGVTGSGKSTSLAMLIDCLIKQGGKRIVTIEEPIEYLFDSQGNSENSSVITQREVGRDVLSFADGLKFGLRQDPDIVLVGEIRDKETAQIALSAAETGHLVLSTLHSRDAKGAISRFTDLFQSNRQSEMRAQLALGLRAVVCQHLLPSALEGAKRELALEILINNSAVGSAIRLGKLETIDNNILTGAKSGMILLDESIKRLMLDGLISKDTALRFVSDADYLRR